MISYFTSLDKLLEFIDRNKDHLKFSLLIGKNISFSLSVKVHSLYYKYLGLKDHRYLIYDTSMDDCNSSWSFKKTICSIMEKDNVLGANITTPYKTQILFKTYDPNITDDKRLDLKEAPLCSSNTCFKTKEGLAQTTTDILGLSLTLSYFDSSIELGSFNNLIILGSGGMCKSILDYIDKKKYSPKVFVLSRNKMDTLFSYKSFSMSQKSLNSEDLYQLLENIDLASNNLLIINALLKDVDTSWIRPSITKWVLKNKQISIYPYLYFMDLNYDKNALPLKQELEFFSDNPLYKFFPSDFMLVVQAVYSEYIWNSGILTPGSMNEVEWIYQRLYKNIES